MGLRCRSSWACSFAAVSYISLGSQAQASCMILVILAGRSVVGADKEVAIPARS